MQSIVLVKRKAEREIKNWIAELHSGSCSFLFLGLDQGWLPVWLQLALNTPVPAVTRGRAEVKVEVIEEARDDDAAAYSEFQCNFVLYSLE